MSKKLIAVFAVFFAMMLSVAMFTPAAADKGGVKPTKTEQPGNGNGNGSSSSTDNGSSNNDGSNGSNSDVSDPYAGTGKGNGQPGNDNGKNHADPNGGGKNTDGSTDGNNGCGQEKKQNRADGGTRTDDNNGKGCAPKPTVTVTPTPVPCDPRLDECVPVTPCPKGACPTVTPTPECEGDGCGPKGGCVENCGTTTITTTTSITPSIYLTPTFVVTPGLTCPAVTAVLTTVKVVEVPFPFVTDGGIITQVAGAVGGDFGFGFLLGALSVAGVILFVLKSGGFHIVTDSRYAYLAAMAQKDGDPSDPAEAALLKTTPSVVEDAEFAGSLQALRDAMEVEYTPDVAALKEQADKYLA